ncbi:carbohydrate ABC transporter permease [Demequina aurantiaca]|uniref:carbohydrate ABC transporter permease n=1 Tax=Demequina aurantiaca TaxID=676200 RepID=UPI000780EBBB|nr:sugar ABC transporter permease [Demequina aurantiaca]
MSSPVTSPKRQAQSEESIKAAAHASKAKRRARRAPYWLIAASIGILLVGTGYPTAWQLVTSTQSYGLAQQFGAAAEFIGLQNYIELLSDTEFWQVVGRSLVFCFVVAGLTLALGLAFALLMNAVNKAVRLILQISMLLAWAMPIVASMTVWTWLFDTRRGVVNYLLDKIPGVDMYRFDWFASPWTFFLMAGIIVTWMSVPFVAFSIFAGLTQVSDEVLEASALDGASNGQRLRLIILPMIKPVIAIVMLLQVIWDLRVFAQIKILQDAGASGSKFDLLGTYIYKVGTGSNDFASAAAASVIVLILTISISWWYVRKLMKEED